MIRLLLSNEHSCLRIDFQLLACLQVSESGIFDFINTCVIVLESSLTFIQVPKFFLGIITEIQFRVLKVFFTM